MTKITYNSSIINLINFLNKEYTTQTSNLFNQASITNIEKGKVTEIRKEMLLIFQNHIPLLELIDERAVQIFSTDSTYIQDKSYNTNSQCYLNGKLNEIYMSYLKIVDLRKIILQLIKLLINNRSVKHEKTCEKYRTGRQMLRNHRKNNSESQIMTNSTYSNLKLYQKPTNQLNQYQRHFRRRRSNSLCNCCNENNRTTYNKLLQSKTFSQNTYSSTQQVYEWRIKQMESELLNLNKLIENYDLEINLSEKLTLETSANSNVNKSNNSNSLKSSHPSKKLSKSSKSSKSNISSIENQIYYLFNDLKIISKESLSNVARQSFYKKITLLYNNEKTEFFKRNEKRRKNSNNNRIVGSKNLAVKRAG